MLLPFARQLLIASLLAATANAATLVDSWAVDYSDGIAVSSYFSDPTAGLTKTTAGVGIRSGIDGQGALKASEYPPGWPSGYPLRYEQYIARRFTALDSFDLKALGASLRIQVKTALSGSLDAGAMFVGITTPTTPVYVGASFGIDFSTITSNPLASSFYNQYGDQIDVVDVDAAVLPNNRWLELDVTVTYDAFANQLVLHLNDWSLYDAAGGGLLLNDALDPSFQGTDVRYDLVGQPTDTLFVRPAFMGLEHVYASNTLMNATVPLWDQFSFTYVTAPEPGGLFLLLGAGLVCCCWRSGGHRAVRALSEDS